MISGDAPQLIGEAPAWLAALEHVSRVAPLDRPILVIGERGTGKELIGERLHFLSRRWEGPFVKVNCAALSEELLDSELFGHERGAFTGATERRAGRFELANGGTIFLDEIATASSRVQEKLLRIIEYGEYQRLGGEKVLTTDVRVTAATNVDLPALVDEGKFRADLLDRLAFDVITLPPLRARGQDASLLADFLRGEWRGKCLLIFPVSLQVRLPGLMRRLGQAMCERCAILPSGWRIGRLAAQDRISRCSLIRLHWTRLPLLFVPYPL